MHHLTPPHTNIPQHTTDPPAPQAPPPGNPLQDLEFRAAGLTSAGLAALAPLKKLRRLALVGLELPGPGLAPLLALTGLQELVLGMDYYWGGSGAGEEGVALGATAEKLSLKFK